MVSLLPFSKDIKLPEEVKQSMASEAEAQRHAKVKVGAMKAEVIPTFLYGPDCLYYNNIFYGRFLQQNVKKPCQNHLNLQRRVYRDHPQQFSSGIFTHYNVWHLRNPPPSLCRSPLTSWISIFCQTCRQITQRQGCLNLILKQTRKLRRILQCYKPRTSLNV